MTDDQMQAISSLKEHFQKLPEPRTDINIHHSLVDIAVISCLAILSGADGPTDINDWANTKKEWLETFLELPWGIPSRDCCRRLLGRVDPIIFQQCFLAWINENFFDKLKPEKKKGNTIAIDGKSIRRSGDKLSGKLPIHMVSAWCSELHMTLGQIPAAEKPDEIAATLELLDYIDIKGDTVTTDALCCQKKIAKKIIANQGDYTLAIKGDQKSLYEMTVQYFEQAVGKKTINADVEQFVTEDKSHGREEVRYHYIAELPIDSPVRTNWSGAKSIGMVIRQSKDRHGNTSDDRRYYLLSDFVSGEKLAHTTRSHWGIEASHWILDVVFNEDQHRSRDRRLANNLSFLKRLALSMLKQHPYKASLKCKRKKCGWNHEFLLEVLEFQA